MASSLTKADRIAGAIVGLMVGDAAVMPLHWNYDLAALETKVAEGEGVSFHEPVSCPYYGLPRYPCGALTPYGDEVVPLLESLAEKKGLDVADFTAKFADFVRSYDGRLNHATKDFLANVEAGKVYPETGADNDHAHNVYKAVVMGAALAGSSDLHEQVERAIRVHQNNDAAVSSAKVAAELISRVIQSGSISETLAGAFEGEEKLTGKDFMMTLRLRPIVTAPEKLDHTALVCALGPACTQPGSLLGAFHALALHPTDIVAGLEATVMATGDQAGRGAFVAAAHGAEKGVEGLPAAWLEKCGPWLPKARELAETIASFSA